ncbi:MAG: hypothetical protein Q8K59_08910 [Nitrosomonas sp.]|nr:hypothetical protein [Nitrosomonas sp.]MDP1951194.1 hypothetical protein [Nitrosomonas sp.]
MKPAFIYGWLFIFAVFADGLALAQDKQTASREVSAVTIRTDAYGDQLGTVYFPVSCNEDARQYAAQGLALLHHMTYEGARTAFAASTAVDADCAMGYWGQAMSFIHPLWSDPPNEADFEKAQALVNEANSRGQKTEWEKGYIAAVEAYFAQGRNRDEKVNLMSFEEAWQRVYQQFPEDVEAASFYALAHLATADTTSQGYVRQQRAAEIAQRVLARAPDHPGAQHYIIHAYDYPPLAEKALAVARSYGEIAANVPHALHMPSHIFTRLGLWQESITMNQRAAAIALAHPVGEAVSLHYLHALDYLAYAYLQRAEDGKVKEILDTIKSLKRPSQIHVATAYTMAAVPARFALERQQWAEAASLELRVPNDYPWDQFPAMEAITHFARALGAARSGNEPVARQALGKLTDLHDQVKETSGSWAEQIDIQRLSAKAWLLYQEGKQAEALKVMRMAAKLEVATEKHPVTPGAILPARELLADMLLGIGRYQEAQAEYLAMLENSPNRFNSLYGVARAAELEGDNNQAALYYRKLIKVVAADAKRARLQQARIFLEKLN